jgi:hypothetical protein
MKSLLKIAVAALEVTGGKKKNRPKKHRVVLPGRVWTAVTVRKIPGIGLGKHVALNGPGAGRKKKMMTIMNAQDKGRVIV